MRRTRCARPGRHAVALWLAALTLGLLLSACGGGTARPATGAASPGAAAPGGVAGASGAQAPRSLGTLRVAIAGLDSNFYAPIYIAQQEGFYRQQGLELEIQEVNPPTATQAMLAGQFDVAHAASPGLAAAMKGAPLKLIYVMAEPSPYWILARKDLRGWTDLKGKTIGVSSTAGTQVLDVGRVLAMHGVNAQADGVNYVVPGGPGDEHKVAGLRAGSIDAGVFAGVGTVVALDDGYPLIGDMHAIRTYDYTLWASNQALGGKAEQVQAFVLGTLQGLKVYRHNRARAVEHVTAQLGGNRAWAERLTELSAPWFTDDGLPTEAGLREAVGYKETPGEPSAVTADGLVRLEFARQAAETLARTGWQP